jgi:hypothetical protein
MPEDELFQPGLFKLQASLILVAGGAGSKS